MVNFLVLSGLIIPPAVVPDHLGAAEPGPVQDPARPDPVEVAFGLSFCILLFRAFIATIPRELDEAAIIDGAGPLRLFFRVIFPLLRSGHRHRDRGAVGDRLQRLRQPAVLPARATRTPPCS